MIDFVQKTWVAAAGGTPDPMSATSFYDLMNSLSQATATSDPSYVAPNWQAPTSGDPLEVEQLNRIEKGVGDAVAALNGIGVGPAPSGGDDTAALTSWLTSLAGKPRATLAGSFTITGTLTVPDGLTLDARGAVLTGAVSAGGTSSYDMVHLGNRSQLIGAEITGGTRTGGHGVAFSTTTGTRVVDCYIHDLAGSSSDPNDGRGISAAAGSALYTISLNRIENVHGQAIACDGSSRGTIDGNTVDTALHGIQWGGGDAATSSTIGVSHINVVGNTIRNVAGGIWGSLGQFVAVTGNDVENCSDVGIDFEGCTDCIAIGNTVHNATNAGLAVFYGCTRINYTGNIVLNDATGNTGAGFKAFGGTKIHTQIKVSDNSFTVAGIGVTADTSVLSDSEVTENRITITTANTVSIRILDGAGNIDVLGNKITHPAGASTSISWEGPSDSRIEGNQIITYSDSSTVGGTTAGIYIVWRNASYPAKRNRVKNNVVRGFMQGIFDDCWGDTQSATLVESNLSARICGHTGSNAQFNNNRDETLNAPLSPSLR